MGDIFSVHVVESIEYLLHEVLNLRHGYRLFRFFSLAKLILKATLAVLHHNILDQSLFLVK